MGRKKGKGRATKKLRAPTSFDPREEQLKKAPHTFIIHRGKVGKSVLDLETDLRKVMEPFTASNLKVRNKNVLKDFVNIAGPLNVTHMMVLSRSEQNIQLRLIRLPRGPTLTFRVNSYSLSKDVVSSMKRHVTEPKQFLHHPLLVMNNFSGEGMHLKLMSTMFQNMLPSINVSKVKLGEIRRCVLVNFNPDDQTVDFRHYNIRAVPVGMSKGVKKIVKAKVPNLSRLDDVSDYLLRAGDLSESEAELDGDHNEVVLPQDVRGSGNVKSAKSAIRLTEIGPRMKLQLIKIEEGVADGEVLYHQYITKSEKELADIKKNIQKKKQLKAQRKREQEDNIQRKINKKEEHKERSLAGMAASNDKQVDDSSSIPDSEQDEDDDAEYFRQEVGQEPDKGLFPSKKGTKKRSISGDRHSLNPKKKMKINQRATNNTSKSLHGAKKQYDRTNEKRRPGPKADKSKQKNQFGNRKGSALNKGKNFKSKMQRPQGKRKK